MKYIRAMLWGVIVGMFLAIISLSKMDRRTKRKILKAGKTADNMIMDRCDCIRKYMK